MSPHMRVKMYMIHIPVGDIILQDLILHYWLQFRYLFGNPPVTRITLLYKTVYMIILHYKVIWYTSFIKHV